MLEYAGIRWNKLEGGRIGTAGAEGCEQAEKAVSRFALPPQSMTRLGLRRQNAVATAPSD